jgi:hypothetical protein
MKSANHIVFNLTGYLLSNIKKYNQCICWFYFLRNQLILHRSSPIPMDAYTYTPQAADTMFPIRRQMFNPTELVHSW